MPSLENRVEALESAVGDQTLCTDPKCLHMELLRLARSANGLPEYPLPPHSAGPEPAFDLAKALIGLNRRPDETVEQHAERTRHKPKRYFDPYFKVWGKPVEGDPLSAEPAQNGEAGDANA